MKRVRVCLSHYPRCLHLIVLAWTVTAAMAQGPTLTQTTSSPPYHPTVPNCPNQANSETPIDRTRTPSLSGVHIAYTCEKCKKRESDVADTVQQLQKIEASACFRNFLVAQDPLDEPHGNSNEQIADDLSKIPVTVRFKFHLGFGRACGGLNDDDTHTIDTKNACWDWYDPESRTAYIGHEISHDVGYTHYCTTRDWNARAGNEMTVPYAAEAAIHACFAEVIKGESPKPPEKIQRTPMGNEQSTSRVNAVTNQRKFDHK